MEETDDSVLRPRCNPATIGGKGDRAHREAASGMAPGGRRGVVLEQVDTAATTCREPAAVGGEGDRTHRSDVGLPEWRGGVTVEEIEPAIGAAGGEVAAVGRHRQRQDPVTRREAPLRLAAGAVEEVHPRVDPARREPAAVGRHRHHVDPLAGGPAPCLHASAIE